MKVLTVLGTRPEIIRLSRVIDKLDRYTNHIIVHTGQNYDYELNKIFFDNLGIREPNHFLNAAAKNASSTIGNVIIKIDEILEIENPDALLVLGDTNSGLSVIPAKRRKIPIFHMEAGNRCYDLRVPEEINRKIIDHTSDINLPYSDIAREYLLKEGFPAEQIIKTGSPMFEVLEFYRDQIDNSDVLNKMELINKKYFVISVHREENVDSLESLTKVVDILNKIAVVYESPIILSAHPRTKLRLEKYNLSLHSNIKVIKPLGFFDYIKLQQESLCVISDSGTISEEASILGFSALNLREVHERPEAMEKGVAILTGLDVQNVLDSIPIALNLKQDIVVNDYNAPLVSDLILKLIFSYTNYINRRVWRK
jgi:UDP-N-acetylglucosamine 2-epimerase (non-hydrolysing)